MKRASFSSRRPRLVHVVLIGLLCTAIAVPLLSNLNRESGTIEVQRGFISAERPIDRLLMGTALGSRKLTTQAAIPTTRPASLRLITPARLMSPTPDVAPDLRYARLMPQPTPPLPFAKAVTETPKAPDYPYPRRKPKRSEQTAALPTPKPLQLEASPDSVAVTLPTVIETMELAAPAPVADNAPRIALVVTAAGIHEATTLSAIDALPDTITLAFAPIGEKTDDLARAAVADGHTVLAEIPMEPMNARRDPGEPLTLRVQNTSADNIARLDKALARVPGASGISSYLGAKFSRSEEAATPVVTEIGSRGMFLFENQPNGQSRLSTLAKTNDVAYAASALAIDGDRDQVTMLDRLTALESQARRDGIAIGVATTYRETIVTLKDWVVEAQKRGVVFVPVTRIDDAG